MHAGSSSLSTSVWLSLRQWDAGLGWEVANIEEFERCLAAYTLSMPNDQRFSLMEILIRCVEDSKDEAMFNTRWAKVRSLLVHHRSLHAQTIAYWACSEERDVEQCFRVSQFMRELP